MYLYELYGPTLTLKELCQIFKLSRSSYYLISDPENEKYIANFPQPMKGFHKKLFRTADVYEFLNPIRET